MFDSDSNRSEYEGGEEVARELIVACGDTAEMFDLVEEALDEVALSIEVRIDGSSDLDVALGGDVGGGAAAGEEFDDGPRAVAAVGDGVAGRPQSLDQAGQGRLVRGLARRQEETNGQAAIIDDGVELGGQSSTRTANGVIRAPFFPPAAC
jgi:hypothetical protein